VPSRLFAFGRERLVWSLAGGLALVAAAAVVVSMTRTPPVDQRVLRYTLPWPEKVTLPPAPNFESGTLSPDGRRLAFLARGSTGNTIWVRELDGAAPHQLSGTGPVQNLFWSPDSRFIGFIAGGAHAVRKIDPSGGPAYTLAEFPDLVSGGSWNQFGDIIVGTTAGPILRVSESDGKVTTITQKDPQKNELAHRWPHFLPDGKHFLFYAYGPSEIVVASLDGSERRTIVHADSKAIYSPPGYLLYVRQDSLLKHPFNADTLTLTGEPVAIAEGVLNSTFTATASFTASGNGVLAWLAGGSASTDRLVWVDRHGQPRSTIGEPGDYRNPRLSPDGKRLAVERMGSGSPEVWILDVSRGTSAPSMKLTNAPLSGQQAAWSPDGLRVAFAVGQPGPATLYQKAASGLGSEEVLVKSELGAGPSDWTPDGRVLYHQGVGQPPTSLMLLDRDGKTRPVVESRFIAIDGRFSPDGKWLAYVSTESGRPQVYLQNFPEATTKMPVSGDGGIQPVWRRDGKELFYLGPDGTLTAVPVKLGATADIGAAQPLFQTNIVGGGFSIGGGIHHQYDVSVDGQQFLILTAGDRTETPFNVIVNWPAAAHR
jgi:Tol biopolymer transport system component